MYLKSLVLKGFKSFADRSVLSLEPGLTAIVGPNGSGKSNISDAVLWVLGERNARNLRGQAMEDVIFAGSSARKATGMAEVELVLDNSDGTLPVDYDEVSIMRRMYRSGESEYLINGTVARRMDVLDILHDTGLGTGTHSIISQGSLDSILRSSPEERRSLIEEAAGVLKHKQRMEKSSRKLEKMNANVARVRDVVAEVERQLGPLARKAKRAQTYAEISGELEQAKLALAVDDLRKLQTEWDKLRAEEAELSATVATCKETVAAAEAAVEQLTDKIRTDSVNANELSRQYQSASSSRDRLDSTAMLIRERRRLALDRAMEIESSAAAANELKAATEKELDRAQAQAAEARSARDAANSKVERLVSEEAKATSEKASLEEKAASLEKEIKVASENLEKERIEQARTRELLSNRMAQVKVLESQQAELQMSVVRAEADAKALVADADAAEQATASLDEQEKAARQLVGTCVQAREATTRALNDARATQHSLEAQIKALEEVERAIEEGAGGAKAWVFNNRKELPGALSSLSHALKPEQDVVGLVETLLGADITSLLAENAESVENIATALNENGLEGETSFVLRNDGSQSSSDVSDLYAASAFKGDGNAFALVEKVSIEPNAKRAVYALLGDVVVCESLEQTLGLHKGDHLQLRFVTRSGDIVYPSGKVTIGAKVSSNDEGVLARLRHLSDLRKGLSAAKLTSEEARAKAEEAEVALSNAQTESLQLTQQLAALRGNAESARAQADQANEKHRKLVEDMADITKRLEQATASISDAQPNIENSADRIKELEEKLVLLRNEQAEATHSLQPQRDKAASLSEQLSAAKLEAATLEERAVYSVRVLERHSQDLEKLASDAQNSAKQLKIKRASATRLEALLAIFDELARSAQEKANELEQRAQDAQSTSAGMHESITEAREMAQNAHRAFDEANEKLNENRVSNARLEVQVQTAVTAIREDLNTPLETALELPQLENREETEETAFRLGRRIANLGTINPDAAEEYEELKSRFDYLDGQLSDLDAAAKALARIDKVIENRMKDDFANTFEEVNRNFEEIFATLFPGGKGHLSFDDPEDLENTGVEVNAQPAGKRITKMTLMSGGEKSLTALALLFAVYRTRTTPFYILDEVEAALDDTNLRRLMSYIDELRYRTQLIMITHQRRTMEAADVLFGVSMQADGVTKVISQRLDRALEYAE